MCYCVFVRVLVYVRGFVCLCYVMLFLLSVAVRDLYAIVWVRVRVVVLVCGRVGLLMWCRCAMLCFCVCG